MFLLFSDSKAFVSVGWDKWWEMVGKSRLEQKAEYMIATRRVPNPGSPLRLGAYVRQEPCLASKKIKLEQHEAFCNKIQYI